MCGFCGFTGCNDLFDNNIVINNMMDKIVHRGPNGSGVHCDSTITLGFRRLSIIDLEDSNQPLYNEDNTIVLTFNGEIYNYKELTKDLIEKGHVFKTHGDSETLIHLYEEYGENMLQYLRGMFSFVIYDFNQEKVFAARDFFGIKPFYYTKINNELIFGSEIKSFFEYPLTTKELNNTALENYLSFQYSPTNETFFKGIYKLMPGHYLVFKNKELSITKYFNVNFAPEPSSVESSINLIKEVMEDSINMHQVSDVEVGSFLSSGVDSSYVAATFNGSKTFTVGFDYEKYNEISYAKELSDTLGKTNYSKIITTKEYWDILPTIQYNMDEPLADPSAVALYFVSNLAAEHVKVALSGEGADEFFGGYNIYKEPLDLKIITDMPMCIRRFLGKVAYCIPFKIKGKNFFIRGSKTVEDRFIGNANIFSVKERNEILKNPINKDTPQNITKLYYDKVKDYDDITKMQYLDIHMWMASDILLKADKMSMANSLEVRVPFLDKKVFEVASKLPTDHRTNKTETKYAFRMAARKILPESVSSKKKLGFPVPIRIWLKEDEYYNKIKSYFCSETAQIYFNQDKIVHLLDAHKKGNCDNSRKIWTIYMFLLWHEQYFN